MKTWRVNDVVTAGVVAVAADTPYQRIAETLVAHRIGAVPVIDPVGRVLGVVSKSDLLPRIEFADQWGEWPVFEGHHRRVERCKALGETAADLMTTPAITIGVHSTVRAAAGLMDEARVRRLPVVSELGRLVGIVSRGDLLRMFQRSDAQILHDVLEQVLMPALQIEPEKMRVEVSNGVVTLTGRVRRRTTARIAIRLCRAVPGVVDVVNRIRYYTDDTAVPVSMLS
jgi:CBS domain-containing protein